MARFLFVVPPLTGHTNPTVSVGRELEARGHEVAWVGHREVVGDLLPPGARLLAVADDVRAADIDGLHERARGLRGPAALKFLYEEFIVPVADHMVPGVERAVVEFEPDVLLVDQQAIAGAVVAERHGLAWATSATTSAELTDPLAAMPAVDAWVHGQLTGFLVRHGLPDAVAVRLDPRFSPHLVIGFTTEALVGPIERFPAHYVLVGPSISDRPEQADFPFSWLDPARQHVLVSLGTVNQAVGARFFGVAVEAAAGLDAQVVLVAPPESVDPTPANVLVRSFVPQLALLPHLDAVVTHGGHNTVCESLAHGLPLVLAPIRDDQPIVAEQVVRAGAGTRVKFGRVGAEQLRAAVTEVLVDARYRQAAGAVADSFAAAGGSLTAADHLEKLS